MAKNTSVNLDIIINADGYSIAGGTTPRTFSLSGDNLSIALSTIAQGHLLYHNGTNVVNLAPSTSGYFLKTQGVGANPVWDQPSHGNLADLSSDDHSQYMFLSGRAGGQILVGGTAAGDDIVFETTSNITKGSYIFSELTSDGLLKITSSSGILAVATADLDYQQVITWGDGLGYAAGTASVDYNTTNLKITTSQLDTIQSIALAATPSFASLTLSSATNQLILGTTNTTTISSVAPSSSRVYTISDVGSDTIFVMGAGTQTIGGNKTFTGDNINSGSVSFTKVNAAGGSAASLTLSGTLGIMDGSDTFRGIYINYVNSNHTGSDNNFYGIDIANITGDAECNEIAIQVGSGWDYGIKISDAITASLWLASDDNDSASGIRFGSTANSVSLYKSANDTLKTDDSFVVGSTLSVISTTTLDTSLSGLLKATAGVVSAASGDTDYQQVITWGDGLAYSAPTASVDYNTTNLKITTNQLDTIQSIATAATPQFAKLGLGQAANTYILSFPASTATTGGIDFGVDTNLYRSAIDTLKTDDSFSIGANLVVIGSTTLATSLTGILEASSGVVSVATADSDYQQVITWGDGLGYSAGTASIDYNATNLKITTAQIDTIQSIALVATPTFASMTLTATTNQLVLGVTNTTTITSVAPAASRVYTIPDAGGAASFVMTEAAQTINGDKTFSGSTSLTKVNAASGSATVLTLSGTLGIMNGSDTFRGIYLNYTNSNHTGTSNAFYGIDINSITADADCTEIAIQIGSGWDYGLKVVDGITASLWLESNDGDAASGILFGNTANTANLYRSANDTLKTDDNFIVGGSYLQISNQSAAPGTTAGMIYTDSDDNTFGWYSGGAWHYAFGTASAPMTSWTLSGDGGVNQTISDGNTASFVGTLGIITAGANTDTLQISVDVAETFTSANAWTGIHEFKNDVKVLATDADADIEFQISDAQYAGGATDYWSIGIDDNSSSSFKISHSSTLGTNDCIIFNTALNTTITGHLTIGSSAAGVDYILTFDGETNNGTLKYMEDENRFDFSSPITTTNITDSGLTITRVPYASTGGLLIDSASMTFDTTNGLILAAGSASALKLSSTAGTALGGILFGTDANLYRSAANMLKTDDSLTIAGGSIVLSVDTDITVSGGASGLRIVNGTDIITMLPNVALSWSMLQSDLSTSAGAKGVNFGAANTTNNSGVVRYIHNGAAAATSYLSLGFYGNDDILSITVAKNVILGTQAALATNATAGFTYIPTCAGAPTGVPTAYTGKVAMIYDTTNNNFYIYNGGWKKTTTFA